MKRRRNNNNNNNNDDLKSTLQQLYNSNHSEKPEGLNFGVVLRTSNVLEARY
jgi:hypothetical protein